ncbi:MAG: hypothetical protein ABJF88_03680 [Rhodothermales bacterium]
MAHRTKSGITVQAGPRMILQRPQMAALLGTVAAEWSLLERWITSLYAYLMGVYLPRTPGFFPPVHPVALQVFDTLQTLHLRLELLTKLADWVVKDDGLREELKGPVVASIRRAAKDRNKWVHAQWGIAPEYPDSLIFMPTFGHQLVVSESDLNEAIDRIIGARDVIGKLETRVRDSIDGIRTGDDSRPL